jgi:uncharacterized membrane protein
MLAVLVFALALVFVAVGIARPVWLDEANSVAIASHGFGGILDGLSRDNNLPAYYMALSVWMRIFGQSEAALRSLSGVFYLGGCAAAYALGQRLSGRRRAAWLSAFLYEVSGLAVHHAQNVRMYALLGMLSGYSTLLFVRLFRDRERSRTAVALYIAVNIAGCFTHVWFGFVLAGQLGALLLFERSGLRRFLAMAATAAAPLGVLWTPYFVAQIQNGASGWMPPFQPSFVLYAASDFYGLVRSLAVYAVCAISLARAPEKARGELWNRMRFAAAIFLVSLAVPMLVSAVKPIYWPGRYMIIALAPLAASAGTVLASFAPRPLAVVLCVALAISQTAAHVAYRDANSDTQLPPGQSDRTTARFLLDHASPGDAIVFTSLTRSPADYYFRQGGAGMRFAEFSFPAEVATHLGWMSRSITTAGQEALSAEADATTTALTRLAASGKRIWVYDGYAPDVNRILTDKLGSALALQSTYPLEGPYHKMILQYGPAVP